jgi:transcriptional regulator with XRE-family HTH domain
VSRIPILEQLRQAIRECPVSESRLASLAGIDRSIINRLMRGEREISIDSLESICAVLGLGLARQNPQPPNDPQPLNTPQQ